MCQQHDWFEFDGCRDELRAAWAIFTPLLHAIDDGKLEPVEYKHGSRGPAEADRLIQSAGFVRNEAYTWGDQGDSPKSAL